MGYNTTIKKKKSWSLWSIIHRLFPVSFFGGGDANTSKVVAPLSGGAANATMVSAMKHFSSPHKVKFG